MQAIRVWQLQLEGVWAQMEVSELQSKYLMGELKAQNGVMPFYSKGISARNSTYVLFAWKGVVVGSAHLLKRMKYPSVQNGYAGEHIFEVNSIKVFEPMTAEDLCGVWIRLRKGV